MRLPRDVSGEELARLLGRYGYRVTRQTGSHFRLTATVGGEHHVTIPRHSPLKVGTLSGILADVADHLKIPGERTGNGRWRHLSYLRRDPGGKGNPA